MQREASEWFMKWAIGLSRHGYPAPNPRVGCVIVSRGSVVGTGYHEFAGGPHAEVLALEEAGERAAGSDVYVTLEPCNHYGRTGPCSQALIEAKVKRVYFACRDENPRARGGAEALEEAGIKVHAGLLRDEAAEVNEVFIRSQELRRPFVTVKAAISLDGRIALSSGESKWITGEEARSVAHQLRAEMGCVLVGQKTVQCDDPSLTVRIRGVRNQPVRVILDPERRLSNRLHVFDRRSKTFRVVLPEHASDDDLIVAQGTNGFNLRALLSKLFQQGVNGVLVEGGAETISSFIREGLVDRLDLLMAPIVLGNGPTWANDAGIRRLTDAHGFTPSSCRMVGKDVWLTLRRSTKTQALP
jgi:diaminohydroxyphosphoribosylaminopyrimidine deaminase/5-amino-6-(5-phosphoribosylamino)uracil reductase